MKQKIRMGMVGGSKEGFIGAVHRMAANLDGLIELVCGCFSSSYEKSLDTGRSLFLPENRIYKTFDDMMNEEAKLPENERMQFVSIVTPNHLHFAPAQAALKKGFHVVLDKPMTFNLDEAKALEKLVKEKNLLFCLTHTYTGYPMLKEAREIIRSKKIGEVRKVFVEYPQGWLSTFLESQNQKQASWRTDPSKSGIAGSMGDIGTHAFNLAEYVSHLKVTQLCADINIVVKGRKLDDDGSVLLKFDNGASGVLMATQVAAGEENNLKIRVYGEKGGLEWNHQNENTLLLKWSDKPTEILRTGNEYLSSYSKHNSRVPSGHPEGYIEAFANLYRNFALSLDAKLHNQKAKPEWLDFPGIEEGVRGMQFVEKVIASGKANSKWTSFK